MASSYLNLYTGAGGYYGGFGGNTLMPKPTIGTQQGTYRSGTTQRVVHDKANNIYYGQQKQSDLIRGLQDSIARTQMGLKSPYASRVINSGTIFQQTQTYKRSAQEIKAMNDQLARQQSYLKNIQGGMYKQEANTFFDSYNDHTQGWNNVFTKRYNNEQQRIRNERITAQNVITKAKNEKIRARNKVIGKANVRNQKIKDMNSQLEKDQANQQGTGSSLSYNVGPSTKLEVNTGLASEKTKNRSKANAILVDNGLNI